MDDDTRALLGLPKLGKLEDVFLAEIKSHPDGLSPRQMHRLRKDVSVLDWMRVGHRLFRAGKVRHSWRPLTQPATAAQESVYTIVTEAPT